MLDGILFVLFSILECVAVFLIMFTIFRIKITAYYDYVIITSGIIGVLMLISWKILNIGQFSAPITLVVMFLFLKFLFKFKYIHSALMAVVGYVAYMFLQTGIIFIAQSAGILTLESAQSDQNLGRIIQGISFILSLILSFLLNKKVLWVTFVEDNYSKIKATGLDLVLFVSSVIVVIIVSSIFNIHNIFYGLLLFAACTIYLVYILIKKEINT